MIETSGNGRLSNATGTMLHHFIVYFFSATHTPEQFLFVSSLSKPWLHSQLNDPRVFLHLAFAEQAFFVVHSLVS